MPRSIRSRAQLELGIIDLAFKLLLWLAYCEMIGLSPRHAIPSPAMLALLVVLELFWLVGVRVLFAPVNRWDPEDADAVHRATHVAHRGPLYFAALYAAHWVVCFVGAAFSACARSSQDFVSGAARHATTFMIVCVIVGSFTIAFLYASWLLAPVRDRLSLAAGGTPTRIARPFVSMRWGAVVVLLGIALAPAFWMMSLALMNDETTDYQRARGWALAAAQEMARGRVAPPPEAGIVAVAFTVPADGPVIVTRGLGLAAPPAELLAATRRALGARDDAFGHDHDDVALALVREGDWIVGAAARSDPEARSTVGLFASYLSAVALFAVLSALFLVSTFVTPILRLAATLRDIAARGEVTHIARIPVPMNDEVGELMVSANGMITRLEDAHAASAAAAESLRAANGLLEHRVAERTEELSRSNRDLEDNLRDLKTAQSELAGVARRLGMAEVASSVLHNVGNVLNSVNVSVGLIAAKLRGPNVPSLQRAVALANEQANLPQFLAEDPRGQLLTRFLTRVAGAIGDDHDDVTRELTFLEKNIDHIKSVVARQQTHARPSGGLVERVGLLELLDDAARFALADSEEATLLREHPVDTELSVDRHHVFQILVNLLRNARDAVLAVPPGARKITLRTFVDDDMVGIEVEDNGAGIAAEHRGRLFQMGFSTKVTGHGYGLHSSILAAQSLGGTLTADSDGPGLGSRFRLSLPRIASFIAA